MKLHILVFIAGCLGLATSLRLRRETDDEDIDLTPTNSAKSCKTKDGRDGYCVHESACTEDHVFQPGGVIDDTEIRIGSCPGKWDWCCVFPNNTKPGQVEPTERTGAAQDCKTASKDSCPWCIGLYRDGGNPRTKSPTGLYCGGALVGSKVVLTSASCVLGGKGSNLWVQLPDSDKHYAVNSTIKNVNFNSGTREQDTALLLLKDEVPLPDQHSGACLGLKTPLLGDCVAIGFDNKDKLLFTPVAVTNGACTEQGSVQDAACGRTSSSCVVTSGSPVLCPSDDEGLVMTGLVRQPCSSGATLLGALTSSADWVQEELSKNAIASNRNTIVRKVTP